MRMDRGYISAKDSKGTTSVLGEDGRVRRCSDYLESTTKRSQPWICRDTLITSVVATVAGAAAAYAYMASGSRPKGSSVTAKEGERKYLIGGNWKCNGNLVANEALIKTFNKAGPIPSNVEVVVCAPYLYVAQCLEKLRSDSKFCTVANDSETYTLAYFLTVNFLNH